MTVDPAPIALFAYNRPGHLRRTLRALAGNALAPRSRLIAFCDAPRTQADAAATAAVLALLRSTAGFRSVEIVPRRRHLGLSRSLISGIGEVVGAYGRVVVMEDDLVTSPQFLTFLNRGLEVYAGDDAVASIQGYWFATAAALPPTFFLRGAECWGWATWSQGWSVFEPSSRVLLDELTRRRALHAFNLDGCTAYSGRLEDHLAGLNDTWSMRWHASAYLAGKLSLYPSRSLVHNIGCDGTGVHCFATTAYDVDVSPAAPAIVRQPAVESQMAREALKAFLAPINTRARLLRAGT